MFYERKFRKGYSHKKTTNIFILYKKFFTITSFEPFKFSHSSVLNFKHQNHDFILMTIIKPQKDRNIRKQNVDLIRYTFENVRESSLLYSQGV